MNAEVLVLVLVFSSLNEEVPTSGTKKLVTMSYLIEVQRGRPNNF